MADLSIGEVSGLIAAAVFLLQLLIPLLVPLILIAFLAPQNTVVTWSVLSRFLHSSSWPSILNTDTAARHGVQRRINYFMWFQTLAIGLISLASILTPLGLFDKVEPQSSPNLETFRFITDSSAFGYGTPARTSAPFTRSCGNTVPCPGMTANETCAQKGIAQVCSTSKVDRSIPAPLVNLFHDGPDKFSKSVSGIFDIQWRAYVNATDVRGLIGWYIGSAYRQMSMLIPQSKIHIVDGLIVDTIEGGIGFRNHTVPQPLHAYGSEWTEDILFIEPETQCVDMNITFDFQLSLAGSSEPAIKNLAVIDHGGFYNLSRTKPSSGTYPNGQGGLDVRQRAYYAAWMANFLTMAFLNLTDRDPNNFTRNDAKPGLIAQNNRTSVILHPIVSGENIFAIEYQSLRSSDVYGEYLANLPPIPSDRNKTSKDNPFGISKKDFNSIATACRGTTGGAQPNINSSLVGCGLIYGAARRTDNGSTLIPDPDSKWSVPLYSCASSFRAIVKTVSFRYNGTNIDSLQVHNLSQKVYSSTADLPQWAVENVEGMSLGDMQPLWGIIGTGNTSIPPDLESKVSTLAAESLRLPGVVNMVFNPSPSGQYLPGVNFYTQALFMAYNIARPCQAGYSGLGDYSGRTSIALYSKWQQLSTSAATAASIINMVWTDVAANAVVGTKGWVDNNVLQKRDARVANQVPVTVYHKRVQYKIPFAFPAFVVIATTVAVVTITVTLWAMRKTGTGKLRLLLDTTSTGRTIGMFLWPESSTNLKTDAWVETVGMKQAAIAADGAFTADGPRVGLEKVQTREHKSHVAVEEGLLDGQKPRD